VTFDHFGPEAPLRRALVVDDEELLCSLVDAILGGAGWDVVTASDAGRALYLAASSRFDLAIVDVNLIGSGGIALCRALRALPSPPEVLLSSGEADPATMRAGRAAGALGFLAKPFGRAELLDAVDGALGGL
jgi:DNA-binding response OmpR family regulator